MTADETPPSVPPAEPAPAPAPPSPGAMIRAARERKRLSVEDLAQQTKLSRATVEALERDDFGALLEPVYVRGYYRKCAKMLELPEDSLISAYDRRVGPTAPRTPAKIRLSATADAGSGWIPRLIGTLLVLAAIGLGAVLWFLRGDPIPAQTPPLVTPELAAPGASPAPSPAVAPTAAPTAPETPAAAASEDASAAAPVEDESAPAVAGEGRISLRFNETSWARINDASGKTLINGLMDAGQQQVLRGELPLSVFLGNAPGVELRFNGEPVPLAPYTQDNNIARFSLPLEP
jgi:cytoskeleton protein RodZ